MQLEPGAVLDGKYCVRRQIGSGSAADVYEAEHLIVGKRVALKVLRSELSGVRPIRMSFVGEARAAAQIAHANVVDIYDLGVTGDGLTYLVMELLRGETLRDALTARGPMGPAYACELMQQVLAGLAAAHAEGIVHRDLKPANVIVCHPRPNRPLVKVLDFGIAMGVADAADEQGGERSICGTPAYMAPEQILAAQVDARADLYSAGAMLFEMLTGHDVLEGTTVTEVLTNSLLGKQRRVRDLNPAVPDALAALVNRALSRHPEDRPGSAHEFARLLSPFVSPDRVVSLGPAPGTTVIPIPLIAPLPQLMPSSGGYTIPGPAPDLLSVRCPVLELSQAPLCGSYAGPGVFTLRAPAIPPAPSLPRRVELKSASEGNDDSSESIAAARDARSEPKTERMRRAVEALRAILAGSLGLAIGGLAGWMSAPW